MHRVVLLLLLITMVVIIAESVGADDSTKVIIAHRGASGYLPEHTLAAYAMAYAQGADYLEPDLGMTRDGILICLHDLSMEATTNIAQVFPDRKAEDGKYYAADFTLDELRQLKVRERYPNRFPQDTLLFPIATFEELVQMTQGLNETTGRDVGIYPELKDPGFYRRRNMPFAETLLEMLAQYGYDGPDANVYIQCFIPTTLIQLREEMNCTLPMIQLISDNKMQDHLVSDEGLARIATYAQGIGPHKRRIEADPTLVKRAHALGLVLHPYTFRADQTPSKYATAEEELQTFLYEYNVDGGFTDHPDVMKQVIESQHTP